MPGRSKKGGGLEVGSAYKMKYNKSSFPFKTDPTKDIDEAKKSLQVLKSFDFDDLLLGDGECILGEGKKTLEKFLSQ